MTHRIVTRRGRCPVFVIFIERFLATNHDAAEEDSVQLVTTVGIARVAAGLCQCENEDQPEFVVQSTP